MMPRGSSLPVPWQEMPREGVRITPRAESVGLRKRVRILLWKVNRGRNWTPRDRNQRLHNATDWRGGSRASQNLGPWDKVRLQNHSSGRPAATAITIVRVYLSGDAHILLSLWCGPEREAIGTFSGTLFLDIRMLQVA